MYEEIFKEDIQNEMREFFIELSKEGKVIKYRRRDVIKYDIPNEFGIVLSGQVGVSVISQNGLQKELYIINRGEVFGEDYFFERVKDDMQIYCINPSEVAYVSFNKLNEKLIKHPMIAKHIYHSLFRKYQILKSQLINLVFRDSAANIADTLVRLAVQSFNVYEGKYVVRHTHQHLAEVIGCSRITVTKVLNELKSLGIISMENKQITILDMDKLKSFVLESKV